jgi:hypothetical protein|tara:strand:+ start:44 stop:280 length:237 start_codon:yes stop_codon:yes gene_type:complete
MAIEKFEVIDGYTFEYDSENKMYECRGEVYWDEDGLYAPERGLWRAALKLENALIRKGIAAEAEHSEKGWVMLQIYEK